MQWAYRKVYTFSSSTKIRIHCLRWFRLQGGRWGPKALSFRRARVARALVVVR
jgi:hypothetical protein